MPVAAKIALISAQKGEEGRFAPSSSNVDWDKFRMFDAVARTGSFSKAAIQLGVQQTTVSRAIEQLEASIGVKLFDRSNSHQRSLTCAGERLYNDVNSAAEHLDRAMRRAHASAIETEGECKLLMSEGVATHWFVRYFLADFRARYPRVSLKLFTSNAYGKSQLPQFDIQIRFSPVGDNEVKTTRVGTFHFIFFASRDYVARHGMPHSIDDLTRHPMAEVISAPDQQGRWAMYTQGNEPVPNLLWSNSGSVVVEAVLAGLGIAQVPSYAFVTDDRLVPLIPGNDRPFGLYLNFSRDASEQPATRAMINYLRDHVFNKNKMPWFRDELEWPSEDWRAQFDGLIQRGNGDPR